MKKKLKKSFLPLFYSAIVMGLLSYSIPSNTADQFDNRIRNADTTGENNNATNPLLRTRVICIGNSITVGSGTANPSTESYPAQLATALGSGYIVYNLGSSARTMMKNGDFPYWNTGLFRNALLSNPDIVIIKLGTNDSKALNWDPHGAEYAADYRSMIDTFRSLSSHPKIFICLPAKVFKAAYGIDEMVLANYIRPAIVQVGKEKGVNVVDIYDATKNDSASFPDGVHPNATGAGIIAAKVERLITYNTPAITKLDDTLRGPSADAYQWYLNGDTIAAMNGGTNQSISISGPGTYSLSLKLEAGKEDRVVTDIFVVDSTGLSPAAPTGLVGNAGDTMITLTWTASANATSYNIKRSTVPGGPYTLIYPGYTETSFTDTGLINNTTYYYVVTATNAYGESSNSAEVASTPHPAATYRYSFTGFGNWSDAAQWLDLRKPPDILPAGSEIIIKGDCVLDVPQTIQNGASLVVAAGAHLTVPGNLLIYQ